jgi:hypothetical protein
VIRAAAAGSGGDHERRPNGAYPRHRRQPAATLRAAQALAPTGLTIETFDIAPIPPY